MGRSHALSGAVTGLAAGIVLHKSAVADLIAACTPCTATLRIRHRSLGPGGSDGVARVRTWQPA